MKILFDSSFLLTSIQLGFDALHAISSVVNAKIEPAVLKETVGELERLSRKRGKKGRQASLALTLVKDFEVMKSPAGRGSTDQIIVDSASTLKWPVATNDMKLKKALRAREIPVVFMKKNRSIQIEGAIDYI